MAFTRWCLGIPPSTYLPDGKALLDQPASCVTLFTSGDENASAFEITVQRSIGSPAVLLKSEASPWIFPGMVTLEWFGRMMCQEIGGEKSEALRAMSEALPYVLTQCCHLLQLWEEPTDTDWRTRCKALPTSTEVDEYRTNYGTKAFPQESTICNVLTQLLDSNKQQDLKRLTKGHLIHDLPLVKLHMRRLAKTCVCLHCTKTSQLPTRSELTKPPICIREAFLSSISLFASNILALSLFEGPDTLLVRLDPGDLGGREDKYGFKTAINRIIESGEPVNCGITKVLAWALGLVGHSTEDVENSRWVISCSKGQAVYPRVFETGIICQPGYLVLHWAPGLLLFDGETYDRGIDPGNNDWIGSAEVTDAVSMRPSRPVKEPLNLVPNKRMEWKVIRSDGYLQVYLACGQCIGCATKVLSNLAKSLMLRECPHDSASPLEKPDNLARYKGPIDPGEDVDPYQWIPNRPGSESEMQIGVVAVDGDAGLQMFAMSGTLLVGRLRDLQIVIRNDSCLQCCLDLCRKARVPLLLC